MTLTLRGPNMKELFAALQERHGLDWDTVAAMAFERSRQHNVSLPQALNDLLSQLDAGELRDKAQ